MRSSVFNTMTSKQDQDTSSKRHNYSEFQENPVKLKDNSFQIINILINDEKHPVSKLNEIMLLLNQKVEYSMEINEEHTDALSFKCIAKSDCITVYGTGISKKNAKKNAAIAFVSELMSNYDIILIDDKKNVFTEHETGKEQVNYVGELQNLCMSLPVQLPYYEYTEGDKSINNMFNVKCRLYGYTTEGEGKSKQVAKRKAASLMFHKIKDLPKDRILKSGHNLCQISNSESINNNVSHTSIQPSSFMGNNLKTVDEHNNFENHIMMETKNNIVNSSDAFYDQIKLSKNPTISRLRKIERLHLYDVDTIQMLSDIGKEERFTMHYEIIPDQLSIKVQVNLSISPALIHVGFGMTAVRAISEASFQVLVHLKTLMNTSEQF